MTYKNLRGRHVIVVDDDPSAVSLLSRSLESVGCDVAVARAACTARKMFAGSAPFDIALVDLYIPDDEAAQPDRIMRGEELAHYIRQVSPRTRIVGVSAFFDRAPAGAVPGLFSAFISKSDLVSSPTLVQLFETIDGVLEEEHRPCRIFLSHGHDVATLNEVRVEVAKLLPEADIRILEEAPPASGSLVDMFEAEVRRTDVAIVVLTADDVCTSRDGTRGGRARQNVILELGYFLGKLDRKSGCVIIMRRGDVEMPSDLGGIRYIDITAGVGARVEELRAVFRQLGYLG
jgi:CheY-like chemotaxis protein